MGAPWYTTPKVVKAALENKGGQRADAQIRRLCDDQSRGIERRMHRTFYPTFGTRYFSWPALYGLGQRAPSWVLELGQSELISVLTVEVGGPATYSAVDLGAVLLEPVNDGPPFTRIELNRGSNAVFDSGDTEQRSTAVTGEFGFANDQTLVSGLSGAVTDTDQILTVTDSSQLDVGNLLRLGTERVIVTATRLVDIGLTLLTDLTDKPNGVAVGLSGTTLAPEPGEVITIDSERMFVEDRIGAALIVRRGADGSPLAAHTAGAEVYVPRALVVERGATGTTATAHDDGETIWRWDPPGPIRTLATAEVIAALQQEQAGYGRTVGAEGNEREAVGRGVLDARAQADGYRRRTRNLAV